MGKRRTRFSLDNAKTHLTGQDVEAATRAALLAVGVDRRLADRAASLARERFRRSCVPTDDPRDNAHEQTDDLGWLVPAGAVASAKPRMYPRAVMLEVRTRRGVLIRVSEDSVCESIGDRAARLSAAGIPVGYVGSVTAAQQRHAKGPRETERLAETLGRMEAIAERRGKELRDLLRPTTTIKGATPEERALELQANRLLAQSRKGAMV